MVHAPIGNGKCRVRPTHLLSFPSSRLDKVRAAYTVFVLR